MKGLIAFQGITAAFFSFGLFIGGVYYAYEGHYETAAILIAAGWADGLMAELYYQGGLLYDIREKL